MGSDDEERLRALSAGLRLELERIETALAEGLSGLRSDAVLRSRIEEERLEASERERSSWTRAFSEARESLEREYRGARLELERSSAAGVQKILSGLEALKASHEAILEAVREGNAGWRQALEALKEKPALKDDRIAALKAESQELAQALREKEESFRAYAEQRRGFDRQMQDRIMALERELEEEKRKSRDLPVQAEALKLKLGALSDELAVAKEAVKERASGYRALAREREELLKALREESEKRGREDEDRRKAAEISRAALAAQEARVESAEKEIRDLRAGLEAAALRLEEASRAFAKRDELAKALREKEELLRLVHGAFGVRSESEK